MSLLLVAFIALIAILPPPLYIPPELAGCSMAHGFVIGEAPPFPGTVEIWKCAGQTLVTLNQAEGPAPGAQPLTRSDFSPELDAGERLMGCRGQDENYDGTVGIAVNAAGEQLELRRAWKADLNKWEFVQIAPTGLVCNRGLTVN